MRCPSCGGDMTVADCEGSIQVDVCDWCLGVWFDTDELRAFIQFYISEMSELPEDEMTLKRTAEPVRKHKEPQIVCPKCGVKMATLNYAYDSNVFLDSCPSCKGIWADHGEVSKIAVFIKGNKKLEEYGKALVAHKNSMDKKKVQMQYVSALGKFLSIEMRGQYFRFLRNQG